MGETINRLTEVVGTTYTYRYDDQGFRRSKTVNEVTTQYVYNGDKLTYQTDGTTSLYFHYDGDNNITGFRYTKGSTEAEYYYVKNLQGDIIGILDGSGKVVVSYAYDAWGVCEVSGSLASTIGQINPIRYRGYYYDTESGLYYLMSRYYDAEVGRFINADATEILALSIELDGIPSVNLFIYCLNNPINDNDMLGYLSAKQLAKKVSAYAILGLFLPILYASYSRGLLAVSAYTTKLVTPIALKAFWWKPWMATTIVATAVTIVVAAVIVNFAKEAKKSAKERAKDVPGWVTSAMGAMPPHLNEKAKDYAKRLLNKKYGKGKWKTGPATEYNQIVKYLTRHLGMK